MIKGGFNILFLILLIVLSPYTTTIPGIYMTCNFLLGKVKFEKNYFNIGFILLFLWAFTVGVLNRSLTSIISSFVVLIYFCSSVYIESYFINTERIEKVYKYLVHFSFLAAVFGIFEKILSTYFKTNIIAKFLDLTHQAVNDKRIYSTFGNPNVAGNWFAIMIIISLYFCSTQSNHNKLFYKASVILFTVALFLTGSRGAFIGLAFGFLIFYIFKFNINNKNKIIFITMFIITLIIAFVPLPILDNIIDHNINRSFCNRIKIWEGCIEMIKIKPFTGWGLMAIWDNGAKYIREYHKTLFHAHNIWITFMTTLGIIGLSIYLYIKVNLFKSLKVLYREECVFLPMLAGIQAVIIGHGLVDFTMIAPQAALLFILCSITIVSLEKQYRVSVVRNPWNNKERFSYKG